MAFSTEFAGNRMLLSAAAEFLFCRFQQFRKFGRFVGDRSISELLYQVASSQQSAEFCLGDLVGRAERAGGAARPADKKVSGIAAIGTAVRCRGGAGQTAPGGGRYGGHSNGVSRGRGCLPRLFPIGTQLLAAYFGAFSSESNDQI